MAEAAVKSVAQDSGEYPERGLRNSCTRHAIRCPPTSQSSLEKGQC